jgi:UDP-glucuronate 4-epimerase
MAIHKFTKLIAKEQEIPIYGDGSAKRDFTFISDIVDGIVRTIAKCDGYNIYNLGESRVVPLMQLIRLIEENLGKKAKIKWLPPQPGDVAITYADISKATRELNYQPKVAIEAGIHAFIEWFKKHNSE